MASVKDVEKVADDLEGLVGQLRSELKNGPDFQKLMEIADDDQRARRPGGGHVQHGQRGADEPDRRDPRPVSHGVREGDEVLEGERTLPEQIEETKDKVDVRVAAAPA